MFYMKTFTVTIDEKMDRTLDELKGDFGKSSKAEVFRLAVALLRVAAEARRNSRKLAVATADDKVEKEILLPA